MLTNVKITRNGKSLTLTVPDVTKDFGQSASGKSLKVASTGGNVAVEGGYMVGFNVYKPNPAYVAPEA